MNIPNKIVVVTGGGAGIGRALCERFQQEGARAIVVLDRDVAGARATAEAIGATASAMAVDVAQPGELERVVDTIEKTIGPIDLFVSNAGILLMDPDFDNAASDSVDNWTRGWQVNVMAHVFAAKALIPRFRARGAGYFLNTVSAAGLLSQIGGGAYSTSKHAALGFAEHLAIAHREHGIKVSVLCPQAVDTAMLHAAGVKTATVDGVVTPQHVAEVVVRGLEAEQFLILPHPEVLGYLQRKTADYDRWIAGMSRLRQQMRPDS